MKEIDRWLELYETHDKYTFVGHLVDDPVNEILEKVEDDDGGAEEEAVESDATSNAGQTEPLEEETVEV